MDRDLKSDAEVADANAAGTRVLSRRNLESYLLDDQVLSALCAEHGKDEKAVEALEIKRRAVVASVSRGNDADDLKSAAGTIFTGVRGLLALSGGGSTADAFMSDTLAPLVTPSMSAYIQLQADIFGPNV